jgi:hypothetical protein
MNSKLLANDNSSVPKRDSWNEAHPKGVTVTIRRDSELCRATGDLTVRIIDGAILEVIDENGNPAHLTKGEAGQSLRMYRDGFDETGR